MMNIRSDAMEVDTPLDCPFATADFGTPALRNLRIRDGVTEL
jgi:hypothetical protein